jgi:hypothetical protein
MLIVTGKKLENQLYSVPGIILPFQIKIDTQTHMHIPPNTTHTLKNEQNLYITKLSLHVIIYSIQCKLVYQDDKDSSKLEHSRSKVIDMKRHCHALTIKIQLEQ